MPIVIGAKRESDFKDPIGMLGFVTGASNVFSMQCLRCQRREGWPSHQRAAGCSGGKPALFSRGGP